jgi:hypothetical protein
MNDDFLIFLRLWGLSARVSEVEKWPIVWHLQTHPHLQTSDPATSLVNTRRVVLTCHLSTTT